MAFTTGDVIRVTMASTYYNQVMNNVMFYQAYGAGGSSDVSMGDVLLAIKDLVVNVVRTLQSASVLYTTLKGYNITTGADVAALDISDLVGNTSQTGDSAAPFLAASIKLTVPSLVTRNGYKRVGGIVEGFMSAQGKLPNTGSLANNIALAFGGVLAYDGTNWTNEGHLEGQSIGDLPASDLLLVPCVVGRVPNTGQYDLSRIGLIDSASMQPDQTTQVTRKYGRGV